jgi:hypothetical protein
MKKVILLILLAWLGVSFAQADTSRHDLARQIVSRIATNDGTESEKSDAEREQSAKKTLTETQQQLIAVYRRQFTKLSEDEISTVVKPKLEAAFGNMHTVFKRLAPEIEQRTVDAYAFYFSENELKDILSRYPDIVSEKHKQFTTSVLPSINSVDLMKGRQIGEGFGQMLNQIQRELAIKSSEKTSP